MHRTRICETCKYLGAYPGLRSCRAPYMEWWVLPSPLPIEVAWNGLRLAHYEGAKSSLPTEIPLCGRGHRWAKASLIVMLQRRLLEWVDKLMEKLG